MCHTVALCFFAAFRIISVFNRISYIIVEWMCNYIDVFLCDYLSKFGSAETYSRKYCQTIKPISRNTDTLFNNNTQVNKQKQPSSLRDVHAYILHKDINYEVKKAEKIILTFEFSKDVEKSNNEDEEASEQMSICGDSDEEASEQMSICGDSDEEASEQMSIIEYSDELSSTDRYELFEGFTVSSFHEESVK